MSSIQRGEPAPFDISPGEAYNLIKTQRRAILILEVSGEARKDKAAKVATARNLWVPAINDHGGFERWVFIEIIDLWGKNTIRAAPKA